MNYFVSLLPIIIFLFAFGYVINRSGVNRKILIVSIILGLLVCIIYVALGEKLVNVVFNGALNFFMWYVIIYTGSQVFRK